MKIFFTLAILSTNILTAFAQDTLRSQDFPNSGDSYVLSNGIAFTGMDALATGPNYTWDFSDLGRSSQRFDTMYSLSATNLLVAYYFINIPLNSNRATHAEKGQNFTLGTTGFTGVYNYFYNSATEYSQPGAEVVYDSLEIPIDNIPNDIIYKFPLKYNDEDSSAFGYSVDLSAFVGFYYGVKKTRSNLVDGWGSLTTPFGTFDVLRVKTTIVEQDSIHIDTLGLGINLPATTTVEYKWLGAGFGLPLLQINTTANDVVTQILYQDSVHVTGISEEPVFSREPFVFPNPATENIFIRYSMNKKEDVKISLYSLEGKVIFTEQYNSQNQGDNFKVINLEAFNLAAGTYYINIEAGNSKFTSPVQIRN